MTIGVIYPPPLRTSLVESFLCDPAEFEKAVLDNSNQVLYEFHKSSSLPTSKSCSTHHKRHRRNVSFHDEVTVVEVERVPKSESKVVWWTFGEMDRFRSEAAKSAERRRTGMKRATRSSCHARKVLVQQCVSEELDGVPTDPKILSVIASKSSKRARESAHRSARKLEEEIEKEVYSHERSNSIITGNNLPTTGPINDRNRTEFYLGAVVDAFTETVTCGIASKVTC